MKYPLEMLLKYVFCVYYITVVEINTVVHLSPIIVPIVHEPSISFFGVWPTLHHGFSSWQKFKNSITI